MILINPHTGKPVGRDGAIYFLAGHTGTGKTTLIQTMIRKIKLPKLGFDFSGEYKNEFGIKPVDLKGREIEEVAKAYLDFVYNVWEKVIIFSEAGIWMDNKGSMNKKMKLFLKEARKRGNWVIMDFHKISEIDINALGLSDRLYLKHTTMETTAQIKKFFQYKEVETAYREVMADKTHVIVNGKKYFIATRQVDVKQLTLNI